MGDLLFSRSCRLTVAEPIAEDFTTISARKTVITGLRVVFSVEQVLGHDPNQAKITVYNLAESTRASLAGNGARVLLEAGYKTTLDTIFVGDARHIESKREGVNWLTTFECGDGERAYKHARVKASFGPGAKASQVLMEVGNATGLPLGNLASIAKGADIGGLSQGYVARGRALDELDKILRPAGYELTVINGVISVTQGNEPTTEPVVILNERTGLIKSPEIASADTKDGAQGGKGEKKSLLKATSLLQPQLKPGRRVDLESLSYKGSFRIERVEHDGDTQGGNWYSNVELVKV